MWYVHMVCVFLCVCVCVYHADFGSVDEARQIAPDKAKSLALMHILPPLPDTLAVWSAPFFVS